MDKIAFFLKPSGFCSGVEGAIKGLNKIIEDNPTKKIYCVHEIVHNPNVVNFFIDKGIKFVESVDEISDTDSIVAFSAHGTNRSILRDAEKKFAKIYNLECPLVNKVYCELEKYKEENIIFYIGKNGHTEAQGVTNYARDLGKEVYIFDKIDDIPKLEKSSKIGVLSQTTLNFLEVKGIFGEIKDYYPYSKFPLISDVCKATFERQSVIKNNIDRFSGIIIIGGKESSNTKELCRIALNGGKEVFFGEKLEEILIDKEKILKHTRIAISGGASTPYNDIEKVLSWLLKRGFLKQEINLNK